ncbi:MAG: LysM peptidoglycan-binding domain-containing protein, partial [Pseudomonadota bacterium]
MPSLRESLVPAASLAFVTAAAIAVLIDAAQAQEGAPVRYGTDPARASAAGPQVLSYRDDSPAPVSPSVVRHRVQPGETVYAVSRVYGVAPNVIITENYLTPPYQLRIGQVLEVPRASEQQGAAPTDYAPAQAIPVSTQSVRSLGPVYAEPMPPVIAPEQYYIVRAGDTLYSLSRRFGLSVPQLA